MITTTDLRIVKAFKEFDDGALALAASRSADIRLAPGEWLIHEGEAPRFFAVISGKLEISKQVAGKSTVLRTYEAVATRSAKYRCCSGRRPSSALWRSNRATSARSIRPSSGG